jgi:flagellin-like hook-associated protein FlgL
MNLVPKISNDAATSGVQNDPAILSGAHARRNSESKSLTSANGAMVPAVPPSLESQTDLPDAVASTVADSGNDIADSNAADAFMTSFRAGILAQPGAAMLAQANLSPQSVYDLLQ